MVDEVGVKEQGIPPENIREFKLGISGDISVQQKGRVARLTHPEFGTTYLIDVTDREDPTRKDENDVLLKGETLGEVFQEELKNPRYNDQFSSNNGAVAVITDQLDPQGRKRVYVGDIQRPEITTNILHSGGFQRDSFHVPFSFHSGLVREYMVQEAMDAIRESGSKDLFSDFSSVAALSSPKTA